MSTRVSMKGSRSTHLCFILLLLHRLFLFGRHVTLLSIFLLRLTLTFPFPRRWEFHCLFRNCTLGQHLIGGANAASHNVIVCRSELFTQSPLINIHPILLIDINTSKRLPNDSLTFITESADSTCRDSVDMQYTSIQKKSPKNGKLINFHVQHHA